MIVWTCPVCGAVTFLSRPDGVGGIKKVGNDCDCSRYRYSGLPGEGAGKYVEDTVLVVWDEEPV
jgi:hypothetical protein